jgi:hypothetical protein
MRNPTYHAQDDRVSVRARWRVESCEGLAPVRSTSCRRPILPRRPRFVSSQDYRH